MTLKDLLEKRFVDLLRSQPLQNLVDRYCDAFPGDGAILDIFSDNCPEDKAVAVLAFCITEYRRREAVRLEAANDARV